MTRRGWALVALPALLLAGLWYAAFEIWWAYQGRKRWRP